jgi:hypothetical protein
MPDLRAAREAIGSGVTVRDFLADAVRSYGGYIDPDPRTNTLQVDLREAPRGLREQLKQEQFRASFKLPVPEDAVYLTRTHPLIEGLATYIMDNALDTVEARNAKRAAKRAGAIRTSAVDTVTTLLLVRFRYHIITFEHDTERQLLAEDSQLLAFTGAPTDPNWLTADSAETLLQAEPDANIAPEEATRRVQQITDAYDRHIKPYIVQTAHDRAQQLYDAHKRVRESSQRTAYRGMRYQVEPQLPPDVLGVYVFLPKPTGGLL